MKGPKKGPWTRSYLCDMTSLVDVSRSSGSDLTKVFAKGDRAETKQEQRKSPVKCQKYTLDSFWYRKFELKIEQARKAWRCDSYLQISGLVTTKSDLGETGASEKKVRKSC